MDHSTITSSPSRYQARNVQAKQACLSHRRSVLLSLPPAHLICPITAHYQNEHFGFIDWKTPGTFTSLTDVFEHALTIARDSRFLGHRPKLSNNPERFAPYYVWETYAQVDVRRRAVGSALFELFFRHALRDWSHCPNG